MPAGARVGRTLLYDGHDDVASTSSSSSSSATGYFTTVVTHTHTHTRTYAVKIYFIMRALLIRGRRKASRRRKFGRQVDRLMLRDTIRDAVLTCTRKLTRVSLIYRTEPTTNGWGKRTKLKSKKNGSYSFAFEKVI